MTVITIISVSSLAALLVIWFIWGRDREKITITTEYYPPDDLDPMQIEYIASGDISSSSMYAMILYWISKGYLKKVEKDSRAGAERISDIPADQPARAEDCSPDCSGEDPAYGSTKCLTIGTSVPCCCAKHGNPCRK